jgi:hypothetical protein
VRLDVKYAVAVYLLDPQRLDLPSRTLYLSASIADYRPQAELFGGRVDGKFVIRLGKD